MNTKKLILSIVAMLVVLIALPLIAALFAKKDFEIEREIVIAKPKNQVFEYILLLKNQDKFSKWANIDPKMKKEYRGTDGTVGFVSAWNSEDQNVGVGEQEIKKITDGERIDYELRFIKPFASTAPAYMITETVPENQTKVKWGYIGTMAYPMNLMIPTIQAQLAADLDEGLKNLKKVLESDGAGTGEKAPSHNKGE